MRTSYFNVLLVSLMGTLSMQGQKATMFIPYQFSMEIDTSVWAVPYLVPHPSDYANKTLFELFYKPTSQVVFLQVHSADKKEDMSTFGPRMMSKANGSNHLRNNFSSKTQLGLYTEVHKVDIRPTYVRGCRTFDEQYAVTYNYTPNGDSVLCNLLTDVLSETLGTMRYVNPSTIDAAAGLPRDYSKGMEAVRLDVYKRMRERMALHGFHNKFYYRDSESYWSSMRAESVRNDTVRFDYVCLPAGQKYFSFQRVANEFEMMNHLPIPNEEAVKCFMHPTRATHDRFRAEAHGQAVRHLNETLSKQIGTPIVVASAVTAVPHTDDIRYLTGNTPTQSYFIVAMNTPKGWMYYPTMVNQLDQGMANVSIRSNFLGYDNFGTHDRTFVMRVPSSTSDRSFAFGIVPTYRKVREKYVEGISKRFVVSTNTAGKAPVFLPSFKIDPYEVVFEMIPPVPNNTKFMTHPFEAVTTRNKENIQYSIHYADEQKLLDSRYNGYQKIGVDDPTRRAYITSLHVTDCNRNGKEEVWYALIANGKIVEIHGLENTPQGLKPLVLTDAFKSLIQLEKQVILLMTLSLEKQDPFQRHPPMGTSGMGSGNGGGGNYPAQYERIFDREGATMEGDFEDVAVPVVQEESLNNEPVSFAEVMPLYPGGEDQMLSDLAAAIVYPAEEKDAEIQGTVYVQFTVELDGRVSDVKTMRGVSGGPNLSRAAENAVKKLKPFTPGYQNGKPIRVRYNLPIKFKLN
jgi:TonB family protein